MDDLAALRIDRGPVELGPARRSRWVGVWVGLAALILLLLFWGPLTSSLQAGVQVETALVTRLGPAGAVEGLASNGYVVAARRAALSADTPGRIVELNVREGSVVQAGDVVARLYSDEYAAAVRRAEAQLQVARAGVARGEAQVDAARADLERLRSSEAAAQAAVEDAQAQVALAEANFSRARGLVQDGVLTTQDLDAARAAIDGARARLRNGRALLTAAHSSVGSGQAGLEVALADQEVARAQESVAQAALEQAQATLVKTAVRAPFDGVVVLKDAEVGEVVSPNTAGTSNARGSVVTMVDFASLEVQVDVPETNLHGVHLGGACQVFLDAWPDQPYAGKVERIWPTADRQKATVEVRISFADPDDRLRPDMGVRVVFLPPESQQQAEPQGGLPPDALLVPETAVFLHEGASAVYRVEDGRARLRPVQLGAREGGQAQVLDGLSEGDRVVVSPPGGLEDGAAVRLESR